MKKYSITLVLICLVSTLFAQQSKTKKTTNQVKPTKKASTVSGTVKQENKKMDTNEFTTASGLKVKITEKGTGKQVMKGDKVTAHYTGTLEDGKKFDSSKDRNQPFSFKVGTGQVISGWDEGFQLLSIGDKATFTIPSNLGYGANGAGGVIPPNATLFFDVEVLDAVASPAPKAAIPYDVTGLDTIKMQSGLKFLKVESGTGEKAQQGKYVSVHYTGYLMDGKKFDSSVERGEPIEFQLGKGMVIKGWEEGIELMHVGDKMRFIIPSELAYGEKGAPGAIPANATLIFDCELVGVQ
ncbi:MAG: FKBP-type peptidyl-prolyl cis-trans isomerase [Bacteroidia bacterium]|nr:FKBP-type peptidyl-prolyl cis-trans isomerase [Bacteroidia bacterium]